MFRVFFATIHILKWKCRYQCSKHYKVQPVNLLEQFKQVKKRTNELGESTDDEEINRELDKLYENNKEQIGEMVDQTMMHSSFDRGHGGEKTRQEKHDMTIGYMSRKEANEHAEDSDYDFKEFEGAEVEEAEDRIYDEYKKRQLAGEALEPDELADIAGNVPIQDMNESVVMSALQGRFEHRPKLSRNDTSNMMLDISAMMQMPQKQKQSMRRAIGQNVASSQSNNPGGYT